MDKTNQSADDGRGKIKHNHLAALVTSKLYRQQIVKAKNGKGAYSRKAKRGQEPYLIAA
jgi:alternative ribosome-rescue factor